MLGRITQLSLDSKYCFKDMLQRRVLKYCLLILKYYMFAFNGGEVIVKSLFRAYVEWFIHHEAFSQISQRREESWVLLVKKSSAWCIK